MEATQNNAKLSGALYLIMAPFAFFSMIYMPSVLFVTGDVSATIVNIKTSPQILNYAVVSWLINQLIFTCLVLSLYQLLRSVSKNIARVMLVLALAPVPIAFVNELNYLAVLNIINSSSLLQSTQEIRAQVSLFLDLHTSGIYIAHIFWGMWMLPFGYLVIKSKFIPKIFGYLLLIGGTGYLTDFCIYFFLPDVKFTLSIYTGWGEVLLPLWLLIKGVNINRQGETHDKQVSYS